MPSTPPVPSKRALRILRNLALGTSCTAVFGVGVIVEDQRRRIQTLTKVVENGKKLKSLKNCHSSSSKGQSLEAQALHLDDRGWPIPISHGQELLQPTRIAQAHSKGSPKSIPVKNTTAHDSVLPLRQWKPVSVPSLTMPRIREQDTMEDSGTEGRNQFFPGAAIHTGSDRLASDIMRLLKDEGHAEVISAATSRLIEAFEDGCIEDISEDLIKAAARLSEACSKQLKFQSMHKILNVMLSRGPIAHKDFLLFQPDLIMKWILGAHSGKELQDTDLWRKQLNRAASLILTKFSDQPKTTTPEILALANELLLESFACKMYSLTQDLFERLSTFDHTPITSMSVYAIIVASYQRKDYNGVVQYFQKLINNVSSELQFETIVQLTLDSASRSWQYNLFEEIISTAARVAQTRSYGLPALPLADFLRSHWLATRDISKTVVLFDYLQRYIECVRRPWVAYSAIIQFCIESDQEQEALSYFKEVQELWPLYRPDLRLRGHFALAKAKRGDWDGVVEDFSKMHKDGLLVSKSYHAIFTPIYKVYADTHSLSEVEAFLRLFVEQYDMPITSHLSNVMVGLYGKTKEVDSICRWIEYVITISPWMVNGQTFNIILVKCRSEWQFTHHEAIKLYNEVKNLGGVAAGLVNDTTVEFLRRSAIAESKGHSQRLESYLANNMFKRLSTRVDNPRAVQWNVHEAMARKDPLAALSICQQARNKGLYLNREVLGIAVKASLQVYGDNLEPTMQLLHRVGANVEAMKDGGVMVLIHQLLQHDESAESAETRNLVMIQVKRTLAKLEQSDISISYKLITHTATSLARRGYYRAALHLWLSHSRAPDAKTDLHGLMVCLRAFVGLQDHAGVKWVIEMLSIHDITPDKSMRELLKEARKNIKMGNRNAEEFSAAVEEALVIVKQKSIDAICEKEDVKVKTLNLMKKAIWYAETHGTVPPEPTIP